MGIIPIHSATNKLNKLKAKCKINPKTTIPEIKNLKPRNAIFELNPIETTEPTKKLVAKK